MKLEYSNFEISIQIRFSTLEIRLPNTGWSKFCEISTMPALNSGHRHAINQSKCQMYLLDAVR